VAPDPAEPDTPVARPENPFAAPGVGARYALGRPYHHPRALERALNMLGATRVASALDVACGTGMSTRALFAIADAVVGVDRSPEMLAIARTIRGPAFVRSAAELLPFADGTFDALTVCSGIHWFDQDRFFPEARRILRPDGWVALYDHYFIGEMTDVPEFAEWTRAVLERFPLPARNLLVGDPRGDTPPGFDKVGDEFYADDIEMTQAQLVDYQLSVSNFVDAAQRGESLADLRAWIRDTTAPYFVGVPIRTVRFLGSLTCLRPTAAL
jgi:ubiquinone/menaquinone biosynthesis C-methylase UbiE